MNTYLKTRKLIAILKVKIDQGYDELKKVNISTPEAARIVVNMAEFDATINQLMSMRQTQAIMSQPTIELEAKKNYLEDQPQEVIDALSKNDEDVEVMG